jgi:branched-chain amino acid transport system permease protein
MDWTSLATIVLNGLAIASGLFIVSSGLSIIFGVSRITNFAHGSIYMLGAYIAHSIITWLPIGPFWFFAAILLAAIVTGAFGLLIEVTILRRLYDAPHHLQIIATFGVFLIVRDVVLYLWGPAQLMSPNIPEFMGATQIAGRRFPDYYFLMYAISLVILGLLWLLFHKTRWGLFLRAAIQDREMVAALGVNQKLLFSAVFVLGAMLAGFAGGLDLLRVSASLDMDVVLLIDAFAVVIIGGMGSIFGSFLAAIIVGLLISTGTIYFRELALALVFVVMGVVLLIRPQGIFGRHAGAKTDEHPEAEDVLRPASARARYVWVAIAVFLASAPFWIGAYWTDSLTEIIILALFAWSFYMLAGACGVVSFGQAAFLALGIYAPALLFKYFNIGMVTGLLVAPVAACIGAALFGWISSRLTGLYFSMLTLAFAQILWAIGYQWTAVTNGELGIIGVFPAAWANDRRIFYFLALVLCAAAILAMRRMMFSPFGYSLRAGRDSQLRAEATGINVRRQKWIAFVIAGAASGLAGGLTPYHKAGAFPAFIDLHASIDVYVMGLLGGLGSLDGPILGAVVYRVSKNLLQTSFHYWSAIIGVMLILVALFMPRGINGLVRSILDRRARRLQGTP